MKAELRKSADVSSITRDQKVVSTLELAEARSRRPSVNFLDPFMRYASMQAKGIGLCTFLVTLAAFQRGLGVTFHYERASFDAKFGTAKMQGHRGELFSITNGTNTHIFSRTAGDLTDSGVNGISKDKHLTKAALKLAGVRTPEGIIIDKSQTALIEKFLVRHAGKRFVVKPHAGSLSIGVLADISAEDVISFVKEQSSARLMVEEFIRGTEYRATVVDGRCIAVVERVRPFVIGDGILTINTLVENFKEKMKLNNPFWNGLNDISLVENYIARQRRSLSDVLPENEKLQLINIADGSIMTDVTESVSSSVLTEAAKSAKALGLCNCGVDLIATDEGKVFVLEINQRSYIGMHSFPNVGAGQGNAVAEAIVDYYFPETINGPVHSTLAYNFAPILAALESAQVSDISLPVIGSNWNVLRFVATGMDPVSKNDIINVAARVAGIFVMSAPIGNGKVECCFAYAKPNWCIFLNSLPSELRAIFEKTVSKVS